ncbi:hypothetical protein BDN72DRAFT_835824 [Pluteus cervinus]|uniref:Uncharacterized protein n=1 Tax=Pluteus cervinus TaxID=181527 RepID=A0ACD3B4K6_9AGAR|nr:hypothetical protein BDN72DRAFT_835824 [Pluteus cervinus]
MTTSFAAFASQYLTGRQNVTSSRTSDSQPMFFSFISTDSRGGHDDADLDDTEDPHFREMGQARKSKNALLEQEDEEDEDPYLRLDEDEHTLRSGFNSKGHNPQSTPLIASSHTYDSDSESPRGWLAHQPSPLQPSRSPSPASSSSSEPSPDMLVGATRPQHHVSAPPTTNREPISLSLTESLLPRDGRTRPLDVFSLPDPRHTPRGRRKYNDYPWTALWCAGVSFCLFFSILLLFITRKPQERVRLPYTTLLHTVPLLTILTFASAVVAYSHIYLLRIFARPMMIATSVFIPATLFISAIWAFVGSFMWDGDTEPTWGETVGLRLFSLVPLVLSVLTARRLVDLPRNIHTTSSTLTLSTNLLIDNPFLLALSPTILLFSLLFSIPFLTLIFRLLLHGHIIRPTQDSSRFEWHVYAWANWCIVATVVVWLWTWGVARGILRMTCAGVIGAWYFANPDAPIPPPTSTHTIHAAITRSTGPSLGTIALSALILTAIRLLVLLSLGLERLPIYLPSRALFLVSGIRFAVGALERITAALSQYALIYAGLTGDPFMPSAKRARQLTTKLESRVDMRRRRGSPESPLTLLTIAPLTLTFPFALITYLFVAHTLDAPDQALGASFLAAGVTGLVGLFCVGLVKDTVDTLYLCYCIDKDTGEKRRAEVFNAFEYNRGPVRAPSDQQGEPPPLLPTMRQPPRQQQGPIKPLPPRSTAPIHGSRVLPKEERPPKPQVGPSTSGSQIQRAPLAPPPTVEDDEDDVNPFEQSYAGASAQLLISPTRSSPPSATSPPRSAGTFISKPSAQTHSRSSSSSESRTQNQLKSSRELNMKIPVRHDSVMDSDSEDEVDGGSQFFPGSGLFRSQ